MFEMIDRKSQIDALSPQGETIPDFQGNIQFRGVQFAYPSRSNVTILHSLDLDIPADQTTALVGARVLSLGSWSDGICQVLVLSPSMDVLLRA